MPSDPVARLEPISDPRAVEAWWAESEIASSERARGKRRGAGAWGTVAAMGLTAYGGLLGIGFVFGLILTAVDALGVLAPAHPSLLAPLVELDALTAVGAWLSFELADTVGFGTTVEWDPASPP